jgi:hypothetical protein
MDLKHEERSLRDNRSCAQRQRRNTMPRFATMNSIARVDITATAAMVAAVGIALLAPSATAQPGSSPNATSAGVASDSHGARRTLTERGVRFSFKVPTKAAGERSWWERHFTDRTKTAARGPISLNKSIEGPQDAEAIIYWTSFPHGDYADPCDGLLDRSVGRSVGDLVAAVSTAPGTKLVKGLSDVTLGGHPAKYVVLTVRKNVGCDPGFFFTWRTGWGGAFWRTTDVGDTIRVWVVPIGGTRLVIAAETRGGALLEQEIQQIVESIRFG